MGSRRNLTDRLTDLTQQLNQRDFLGSWDREVSLRVSFSASFKFIRPLYLRINQNGKAQRNQLPPRLLLLFNLYSDLQILIYFTSTTTRIVNKDCNFLFDFSLSLSRFLLAGKWELQLHNSHIIIITIVARPACPASGPKKYAEHEYAADEQF